MKSKDRLGKGGGVTHFRQKASGQIFKDDVDSFRSSFGNFASCSVPFEVVYVPFNDQKVVTEGNNNRLCTTYL
jgi:hypothetical protein